MVAALLHLDKGAGTTVEAVDQVRRGLARHLDIVDLGGSAAGPKRFLEGHAIEFFLVAQDRVDLRHIRPVGGRRSGRRSL